MKRKRNLPDPRVADSDGGLPTSDAAPGRLHRLAAVRRANRMSRRALADRLQTSTEAIESYETGTSDVPLSTLHAWAAALGIPVKELLVDPDESQFVPLMKRKQALRFLKTARAILQRARHPRMQRMTQTLIDQLVEIAPGLHEEDVRPAATQRDEGTRRVVPRSLPTGLFMIGLPRRSTS
jgi:transcriptional regulator with XRE-family HTH domain